MRIEQIQFLIQKKPQLLNRNQELYFEHLKSGSTIIELTQILIQQGWLISFSDLLSLLAELVQQNCLSSQEQRILLQRTMHFQNLPLQKSGPHKNRSLTLAEISFLRNLKPETRMALLQGATRVKVPEGRIILKEGASDRDLYAVTQGSFSISRGEKFLSQIGPGVCFGEAGFFLGKPRTATIRAAQDSEVLKIPWRAELDQLMNQQTAQNLQIRFWIQHSLSSSSLFRDLPSECFDFLSMIGKVLRLKPQQNLILEGQLGTNAYLIIQGEFAVLQKGQIIRRIHQGDFVGEVGLMKTGGKRTASVRSETDSLVLEIPQGEFYSMLGQNILIGHQLETLANQRLLEDQRRHS